MPHLLYRRPRFMILVRIFGSGTLDRPMEPFPAMTDRRSGLAATMDVRRIDDTIYDFRLRLWVEKDTWLVGLQQLLLLNNLKQASTHNPHYCTG